MTQKKTITIPDKLKPFVRDAWYIDGTVDNSFQYYADGTPGIVFQQRDTGLFDCGNAQKIPGSYVFGHAVKPFSLNAPKDCIIIGISLYPHVLQSLFRFSAKEITDNAVDLKLLPAIPRVNVSEQIWNTSKPEDQLSLIFKYLEAIVCKNSAEPDKGIQYAVSQIMQFKGCVSLFKIQTDLNLSERTFERRFEQQVGLSPRLLASISQFQTSLLQLKEGKFTKLSDIAYDNGYADQSHFIRSFKKFTNLSPLQFIKQFDSLRSPDSFETE